MNNEKFIVSFGELDKGVTLENPVTALAYTTAVMFFNHDFETAKEIADFCANFYFESNYDISVMVLVDFVCENYLDFPNDYNQVTDIILEHIANELINA